MPGQSFATEFDEKRSLVGRAQSDDCVRERPPCSALAIGQQPNAICSDLPQLWPARHSRDAYIIGRGQHGAGHGWHIQCLDPGIIGHPQFIDTWPGLRVPFGGARLLDSLHSQRVRSEREAAPLTLPGRHYVAVKDPGERCSGDSHRDDNFDESESFGATAYCGTHSSHTTNRV